MKKLIAILSATLLTTPVLAEYVPDQAWLNWANEYKLAQMTQSAGFNSGGAASITYNGPDILDVLEKSGIQDDAAAYTEFQDTFSSKFCSPNQIKSFKISAHQIDLQCAGSNNIFGNTNIGTAHYVSFCAAYCVLNKKTFVTYTMLGRSFEDYKCSCREPRNNNNNNNNNNNTAAEKQTSNTTATNNTAAAEKQTSNTTPTNDTAAAEKQTSNTTPTNDTAAADMRVSGTIVDEQGEPLSYAHIATPDKTVQAVSDTNGNFSITIPKDTTSLQISYVGFEDKTITPAADMGKIQMREQAKNMDTNHVNVSVKDGDKCSSKNSRTPNQYADQEEYIRYTDNGESLFKCVPVSCEKGYKVDKGKTPEAKCVKEQPKTEQKKQTEQKEKKEKTPKPENVPASDKTKELQKNYDDMKAKEQTLANRLIGGASIGATGIGGQMLLTNLANQNADADAERDMAAYLETFRCDYGMGKNIHGGETAIELPGGNDLFDLYIEYDVLAKSLKTRKDALGIAPGIESEVVIDKAETGLYDNVGTGKTVGNFASLSRALSDPNGADAAAWAAQKADAAQKIKIGAGLVAGGVAIGVVGNVIANKNQPKERSAEIKSKYAGLINAVEEIQKEFDNQAPVRKCKDFEGTNGGEYPYYCNCKDAKARFFPEEGRCRTCDNGMEYDDNNECTKCPDTTPVKDANGKCTKPTPKCEYTGLVNVKADGTCECAEHAADVDGTKVCQCVGEFEETEDAPGKCTEKKKIKPTPESDDVVIADFDIPASLTFATGSDKIDNPKAKDLLDKLSTELEKASLESDANADAITNKNLCLYITGHTDRTKFKTGNSDARNLQLSRDRAAAVKNVLATSFDPKLIRTKGVGSEECSPPNEYPANSEDCRRVNVRIEAGKCSDSPEWN